MPISAETDVILFTSCKGGVGKSTVCANLAMAMAALGKKILLIDCDFGNRCLDIIMGLADDAVYDIGDVIMERIPPEEAIIKDRRNPGINFIAAPYNFSSRISKPAFQRVVKAYADTGNYDYIFIDTPGGIGEPLDFAASVADTAYIIVSPTRAAIRAAERTGIYLAQKGVRRERLIINQFAGRSIKKAKEEVISIIDETAIKLIGVVPYDVELIRAGNAGKLIDEILSNNITHAFENIAYRTMGQTRPLFCNIKKLKKLR
ncbi:MAG: AAA family ATPase [Clostridia bacterium]|nr:AAA family ATPase [Clostridia bacterium]